MPAKIKPDFTPDERSYANLRKHGVLPDFIDDQLDTFKTYWLEKGEKKASWQMTLQVWMRRAHQGGAGREWESNRHIRHKHSREPQGDIFGSMLANLEKPKLMPDQSVGNPGTLPRHCYRLPDPPQPGPKMSSDEAFRELRKIMK